MKTIKIPDFSYNFLLSCFYESATNHRDHARYALADRMDKTAREIETLNGMFESELSTGNDSDCDCEGRDEGEIAVYLSAAEITAITTALERVTFGDLDFDDDVVALHRGMKEIRQTALR